MKEAIFYRGIKGANCFGTKTGFRNYRKVNPHGSYRLDMMFWRQYSMGANPGPSKRQIIMQDQEA